MNEKASAKQRTKMLKELRAQHQETVERTQKLLKEQQAIRKRIRQAMAGGPKILPEIAETSDLPLDQLLWHVTAMKKYELVLEVGRDGEDYQYQLAVEVNK